MSSTKLTLTNRPRLKKIHRSDQNFAKSGHNAWKVYFFIPTNNRKGTIFKPNLSYTFLLELTSCDKVITRTPAASNWCLQRITSSTFAKNGQRFAHNVMTDYRCLANITLQYKSTFINAINFSLPVGREPWSSGYGRRLMFQRL